MHESLPRNPLPHRAKPDEGRDARRGVHKGCGAERVRAPPRPVPRRPPPPVIAHALPNAGKSYPEQLEMLNLVATERRVSVVGYNGAGKDWVAARVILWWIETRDPRITAPPRPQSPL